MVIKFFDFFFAFRFGSSFFTVIKIFSRTFYASFYLFSYEKMFFSLSFSFFSYEMHLLKWFFFLPLLTIFIFFHEFHHSCQLFFPSFLLDKTKKEKTQEKNEKELTIMSFSCFATKNKHPRTLLQSIVVIFIFLRLFV